MTTDKGVHAGKGQANDLHKLRLKRVRLSFPDLFTAKKVNDGGEPKFGACFLLNKETDAEQIKLAQRIINAVARDKWKDKIPKSVIPCLKECNTKDYDGYDDEHMYISSTSPRRPVVVDERIRPVTEADGKIYAGCYVNVTLRLWAQDNQFGKRVNAEVLAVQFAGEGEAFGVAPVDAEEEFESIDPEDDGGIF